MNCGENIEILLVDDYHENTALLEQALPNYKTFSVDNGLDALSFSVEYIPPLILLDINMPDMDGFEVCRKLKAVEATRDIPIIFLTGLAEPTDIAKGFRLGAVDYITKPFNIPEVKARIATQLSLSKARCALESQNKILLQTVREQQINAALARKILNLLNGGIPRYVDLTEDTALFLQIYSRSCKIAGGDHCLVKTMATTNGGKKTVFSLKDQSGHSVNCLLRSIVTDYFHNKLLVEYPNDDTSTIFDHLNSKISQADFFADDDFCTAFSAELDHQNLQLNYLSAGHPPMLLVRHDQVLPLPGNSGNARNLPLAVLPGVTFKAGTIQLQVGDKLILYTDGLNALNRGVPLRQQELIDLVSDAVATLDDISVSALAEEMFKRLGLFEPGRKEPKVELADDLTVLALEIEDSSSAAVKKIFPCDFQSIEDSLSAVSVMLPKDIIKRDDIRMAIYEALLNAWRHGNGADSEKAIGLRWWRGNDWNIEISDQGDGFDPDTVPDPTGDKNRLKEAGRGIFTMRTFCTWVRWLDGGRRVLLSVEK